MTDIIQVGNTFHLLSDPMTQITADEAIELAKREVGADTSVTGQVWYVESGDGKRAPYYLIILHQVVAESFLVSVDVLTGNINARAKSSNTTSPVIDLEEAVAKTDIEHVIQAQLIWHPSRVSLSPFYPVWQIEGSNGIRYVDQQGNVWMTLEDKPPGG